MLGSKKWSLNNVNNFAAHSSEIRMLGYVIGLYATFMYWGYLQEKLTSTTYSKSMTADRRDLTSAEDDQVMMEWNFPLFLNLCMATSGCLSSSVIEIFFAKQGKTVNGRHVTVWHFWKAAITSAIASPIGYASLKYISYPLMILTKSSKPVPVMAVGTFFYRVRYMWYKYVSVSLLCVGIGLYSSGKSSARVSGENSANSGFSAILFGVLLVVLNLVLDGFTANEQDYVFTKHSATSTDMMKYTNFWQAIYLFAFLSFSWLLYGSQSELSQAVRMISGFHGVARDVGVFCVCAACGQILIFGLIKEFGSLVWITVSITRQLFTILLSVFIFDHRLKGVQWIGIVAVFAGLGLDIVMNQREKMRKKDPMMPDKVKRDTSADSTDSLDLEVEKKDTLRRKRTQQQFVHNNNSNSGGSGSRSSSSTALGGGPGSAKKSGPTRISPRKKSY